jgi:hypothetical protein
MPGVKPEITVDWARALAERELEGGEIAFAVTTGGEEYVLRFNRHMGANFEKVVSLCQLAALTRIPWRRSCIRAATCVGGRRTA